MHFWDKTKRNHGLEHATITLLLGDMAPAKPMAGYSIPTGFFVLGDVTTDEVRAKADQALDRMKRGEAELAVSPFCGTNIVVSAGLTTMAALAGYGLGGRGLRGINRAFSNVVFALVASRPIGRYIQSRYTTSGDVASMHIHGITRFNLGKFNAHWVSTRFAD
ncbi:MAG: DUF6391 domain-containing protein [Dehalococcoidia bacterium]